jgi:hypothetical protein
MASRKREAKSTSKSTSRATTAVAVFDSVGYKDKDGTTHYAARGEKIENAAEGELARLKKLGAVATSGSDEAKEAASSPATPSEPAGAADEGELRKMKLDDLRAHARAANIAGADDMSEDELVNAIRAAGAIQPFVP